MVYITKNQGLNGYPYNAEVFLCKPGRPKFFQFEMIINVSLYLNTYVIWIYDRY